MTNNQNRTQEFINNPPKALWKLSIPMMLGMLAHTLYTVVDMYFINNYVHFEDAMASLGYLFPSMFIVMGITFGLGSGGTALISQFIGANKKEKASSAAEHLIVLGVVIGLSITILFYFIADTIILWQGASDDALKYSLDYFHTIIFGTTFMILGIFFRSILSGEGDNIFAMKVIGIGTLLNIILDPIFIYFYQIQGAALATVISQIVIFIIFTYSILLKSSCYLDLNLKKFVYNRSMMNKILELGLPASSSMIIMAFWTGICNTLIVDEDAIEAFAMVGRIEHIFFLIIISIATGLVTLVGMFFGAKRFDLIKQIIDYAIIRSIYVGIVFCGIFYMFSTYIFSPFELSQNELNHVIKYFSIVPFAYPFIAIAMNSGRAMQALGYGMPTLIITFLRVLFINTLLSYLFIVVYDKDIIYIWYSIVLSSILTALAAYLWMKKISNDVVISEEY